MRELLKKIFASRPLLMQLIVVNVAIFLIVRVIGIVALIGGWDIDSVIEVLALPSSIDELATRPWTALTYMVFHYDVFHILFNMLFLYWLGTIMLMRATPRQLLALYIYAGLGGALAFVGVAQFAAGVGGWLLGASASVMGIAVATAILMPDYEVMLMLIGRVKLKWLVCVIVAMFVLGLTGNAAGTHVAHLGGIAVGVVFALLFGRGVDITRPFNRAIDWSVDTFRRLNDFLHRRRAPKLNHKRRPQSDTDTPASGDSDNEKLRRELDEILDKIKRSGYSALSDDERRRLFDVSRRVK